jgi:hypothetical protein
VLDGCYARGFCGTNRWRPFFAPCLIHTDGSAWRSSSAKPADSKSTVHALPSNEEVLSWLDALPDSATRGIGMGDLSIKMEWEVLCRRHRMSRVWVWTLDGDLAGLDRRVVPRRRPA